MKLSVIVCTRNRAAALPACLDAICKALRATSEAAELIVVDNGSTDTTAKYLQHRAVNSDIHIRLVSAAQPGLSRARNAGIKAAQGEWLAFTDDDCRPATNYYQQLLQLVEHQTEPLLIGGRVELADSTDQPYCILTRPTAEFWQQENPHSSSRPLAEALIGANLILHRSLITKVGDFDVRFGAGGVFKGGEEIDYLYRCWLAGVLIRYEPALVIEHAHGRKTLESIRQLAAGYDRGDGALFAKYLWRAPQLLRPLWWDFKKALAEFRGGPKCRPELGISHWQRLGNIFRGALGYFLA